MANESSTSMSSSRAVLWASAFVIAAMGILQAGRLTENPAYAMSAVSNGETFTLVTGSSGRGDDASPDEVLYIIDNDAEVIIAYEIDVRTKTIIDRDGGSLAAYFRNVLKR